MSREGGSALCVLSAEGQERCDLAGVVPDACRRFMTHGEVQSQGKSSS